VEPIGATGFPVGLYINRHKKSSTNTASVELFKKHYVGIADPQWNSVPHVPGVLP